MTDNLHVMSKPKFWKEIIYMNVKLICCGKNGHNVSCKLSSWCFERKRKTPSIDRLPNLFGIVNSVDRL